MTEWPYDEITPQFSIDIEINIIERHLESFHYHENRNDLPEEYKKQLMNLELGYYETLESRLNDGLIWC